MQAKILVFCRISFCVTSRRFMVWFAQKTWESQSKSLSVSNISNYQEQSLVIRFDICCTYATKYKILPSARRYETSDLLAIIEKIPKGGRRRQGGRQQSSVGRYWINWIMMNSFEGWSSRAPGVRFPEIPGVRDSRVSSLLGFVVAASRALGLPVVSLPPLRNSNYMLRRGWAVFRLNASPNCAAHFRWEIRALQSDTCLPAGKRGSTLVDHLGGNSGLVLIVGVSLGFRLCPPCSVAFRFP